MSALKPKCCDEYSQLSRRNFLRASAATLTAFSLPAWLPRIAFARDRGVSRDVLISIFLRGGADGLTLCVPHGDDDYYNLRPTLNIPRPDSGDPFAAIDLDGFFGLPPALAPLVESYNAGHLAIIHACGSVDETRSHFDAMTFMEVGKARDLSLVTGWLGRHLAIVPPMLPEAVLRAVGIGEGLQRTLVGAPLALPIPDLANFTLNGAPETKNARLDALAAMFAADPSALTNPALYTRDTVALLEQIDFANYKPFGGALYPESDFGYAMKSTAALLKAQVGVEAVGIDVGGWDTHEGQGPRDGYMASLMADLAAALAAFHTDVLGGGVMNVTAVLMSEFGRVGYENGSFGTDHGHGNVMMAMGPNINGGQVICMWPGLAPEQLYQGQDLDITIDYRDVLAEIMEKRLGSQDLGALFPDYTPTFHGVAN